MGVTCLGRVKVGSVGLALALALALGVSNIGGLYRYGIGTFHNSIICIFGDGDGNVDPKDLSSRKKVLSSLPLLWLS